MIAREGYPHVLIISANALSKTQNNGKTIATLFDKWPKESISHLFFREESEDKELCKKFFCITDYDVLDHLISFRRKPYAITEKSVVGAEKKKIEHYSILVKKIHNELKGNVTGENTVQKLRIGAKEGKGIVRAIERIIWKRKKWILEEIWEWMKDCPPDVIFLQCTGAVSLFHFAEAISKKYSIPLIIQCLDDFTEVVYENSFIDSIEVAMHNRDLKKIINRASSVITISDKMKIEYKRRFGGKSYFVYSNAVNRYSESKELNLKKGVIFLYMGNLGHERINVLFELGKILDELSREQNIKLTMRIYSSTVLTPEQKQFIKECNCIEMMGFATSDQINSIIEESDFLLHVESFSENFRKMVRLSLSTKIGEYLSSNRCMIAIGPREIASVEYLAERKLALVIDNNDHKKMKDNILHIIRSGDDRQIYIERSLEEYESRFSQEKVDKMLHMIIDNALNETSKRG